MTTVVVCDPRSAMRHGLLARLASLPDVERLDVADTYQELPPLLRSGPVDAVLLASGPGGAEAVRSVAGAAPGARVLLLTMGTDPDDVVSGIAAGAVGYLARDASTAEVAAALALLPPPTRRTRVRGGVRPAPPPGGAILTEREQQVLEGMSLGHSNGEIGSQLFLSEDTVKTHARRLFRKLRVSDRAHAVAEGFRRGLLA